MISGKHSTLILAFLFLYLFVYSQDIPFDRKDMQKLEKVEILNNEALYLLNRADTLLLQLIHYDSLSSKYEKKMSKLEQEIVDSRFKAEEKLEIAYLIESSVYVKIIPQLRKLYSENKDSMSIINLLGQKAFDLFFKADENLTNINVENKIYNNYINLFEDLKFDTIRLVSENYSQYAEDIIETKEELKTESISTKQDNHINEKRTPVAEKIVFKVQIAADRVKLSNMKLHSIYSGDKAIIEFEKDDWFKYCVGEFDTFEQANRYRLECGVRDAFVIAFKNNLWINVLTAKKLIREQSQNIYKIN